MQVKSLKLVAVATLYHRVCMSYLFDLMVVVHALYARSACFSFFSSPSLLLLILALRLPGVAFAAAPTSRPLSNCV